MEKHIVEIVKEATRKLEDSYCVQISDDAFHLTVQGLKTFNSKQIFDDANPEKAVEILDGACKLVFERFRNCAYETSFYEEAHQLRWDLVELIELYNDRPNTTPGSWVTRLRWERDSKSVFMNEFLCRWEHVVGSPGGCHFLTQEFVQQLSLFKEINNNNNDNNDDDAASQKSCLEDVAQFINVIRANLVRSFGPLLTVTYSHVAEVASNLSDIPLTLFLLPHEGYKNLKAKYMTNMRVLEQELVVRNIYETLASSTRLNSSSSHPRPRGSFLLLGQSGAGKTEIAKAVAKHWYCDVSRLVEIDVSDLADETAFWRRLSEVVEKRPYSVIVLDKIDKASSSVTRALVDVLSKEAPRPPSAVDLSNSIIFMTSDVGSDQLSLSCKCHREDEDTHKLFLLNPLKFRKTHDCTLKGSGPERALIQVRKVLSADVLDSVDKVLFVVMFRNNKDVCRVLLREIVRELYGQRLVVHVSDRALNFLVGRIQTQLCGKVLKRLLLEQVIQWLPARQNLNNVVVYVDKHSGTTHVSYSFHRHEQSADDWYFKLKDGTFDRLMANLRKTVESARRIFKLRSEYIGLLDSNDIGSSQVLADNIFNEILKWSPFQETPSDIDITESCVPSTWEREFKDWKNRLKELKRRSRAEEQQLMVELASTKAERRRKLRAEEQQLMDKIELKRRLRAEEQQLNNIKADNEAE